MSSQAVMSNKRRQDALFARARRKQGWAWDRIARARGVAPETIRRTVSEYETAQDIPLCQRVTLGRHGGVPIAVADCVEFSDAAKPVVLDCKTPVRRGGKMQPKCGGISTRCGCGLAQPREAF